MNSQSDTKKMVYLKERKLLSAIATDEAAVCGRSASSVVERYLIAGMMPPNPKMRQVIRELYAGDAPDLPFAFSTLFNAFVVSAEAAVDYARPFTEYYHSLSVGVLTPVPKQSDLLVSLLEDMCNRLHECADEGGEHGLELYKDALELQSFITRIESGDDALPLAHILCILLSSWKYINDVPCTFSLLFFLSGIQTGIRNDADARHGFIKKLKEIPAAVSI